MATQGIAGAGVDGPGQEIQELLDMLDVLALAGLQILYIHTGEAVGLLLISNAGVVRERVGEGSGHVDRGLRMSRRSLGRPVYRSVGLQSLRSS